jgi:hypothetical protein
MKIQHLPKTCGGRVVVTDAFEPKAGEAVMGGGDETALVEKTGHYGPWIVVKADPKNT